MIPWTVTLQAPLSMEFSKQEYWSGVETGIMAENSLSLSLTHTHTHTHTGSTLSAITNPTVCSEVTPSLTLFVQGLC